MFVLLLAMEPLEGLIPAYPRHNPSIITTETDTPAENHGKKSFANAITNTTVPIPSPF